MASAITSPLSAYFTDVTPPLTLTVAVTDSRPSGMVISTGSTALPPWLLNTSSASEAGTSANTAVSTILLLTSDSLCFPPMAVTPLRSP